MPPVAQRNAVYVSALVALGMLLAAAVACVAAPIVVPHLPLPFGYVMSVCAVWQTAPRFQAGIYWASPYFSAVMPNMPPAVGCIRVPWLPLLPQRGGILFG
jgi:hypothetical protein